MRGTAINLQITDFQAKILRYLSDGKALTTYEISKGMKENFWRTQEALRTLWTKGYTQNEINVVKGRRVWSVMKHPYPDPSYPTPSYNPETASVS